MCKTEVVFSLQIISNVALNTTKYILSLVGSTICCFEYTLKEDVQEQNVEITCRVENSSTVHCRYFEMFLIVLYNLE